MADIETNKEELLGAFETMLKKYRIYFLSAVGILLVGVILFTNYDLGTKLTGYIGPTPAQPDTTTDIVPALTVKTKTVTPPADTTTPTTEVTPELTVKTTTVTPPADTTPTTEVTPELTVKTKTVTPPADTTKTTGTTKTISTITLTKATLSATTINPLVNSLTFTIKTSADAKVDIKIYDKDGNIVASPANNKDVTGNKEYEVVWDGDNDAKKTLDAGAYSYKIFAKDPLTKEITDTKTGDITLKYGTTTDFESLNGKTSGSNSATPSQTTQSVTTQSIQSKNAQSSQNGQATMSLQNATSGKTAGTGPDTIIYLIFPILGYTVGKKFK